ncbi:beta-glucosidase 12-like [Cajanus cajan]|uniref:beta-glucosidase 12-like n=1 Tax=Cajanus cajan TaxID=3821 RepID=UPI00098D9A5F|nr:beta-glucosidase 12-like [Cajanus cajan]
MLIIEAATMFNNDNIASLNRSSFPEGFIFGTTSSAYQYEGAANVGGRGPSIWDTFTHHYPDKIMDRSNADVTIDGYHRYKEDIEIMKDMNMDAYKFSISWSRIMPKGKLSGGVNKEGINYYNNLINELLAKGLQPFATIFYWDLPQALEDEYGGFLSPNIVNDFQDYAELCFKEFGDRVKYWITLNDPWTFSDHGYAKGVFAPGRCSPWQNKNCTGGDSATEPYKVAHNQLLAHAAAVNIYRTKYQASQKGWIGITLVSHWMVPLYDTELDHHQAAQRAIDFMLGWFLDPLTLGDYPSSMQTLVESRLPKFSTYQARLVRGSFDFIGLIYHTSYYATDASELSESMPSYLTDSLTILTNERNGIRIGPKSTSVWLSVYPKGIHKLLLYIKTKYNNPLIYITGNAIDELNDPTLLLEEALTDTPRINYYYGHLYYLQTAIKEGVNVKGYLAWPLNDNFEWFFGYSLRSGIWFVDYDNGLKRYPKLSATWFRNFLQHKIVTYDSSL